MVAVHVDTECAELGADPCLTQQQNRRRPEWSKLMRMGHHPRRVQVDLRRLAAALRELQERHVQGDGAGGCEWQRRREHHRMAVHDQADELRGE